MSAPAEARATSAFAQAEVQQADAGESCCPRTGDAAKSPGQLPVLAAPSPKLTGRPTSPEVPAALKTAVAPSVTCGDGIHLSRDCELSQETVLLEMLQPLQIAPLLHLADDLSGVVTALGSPALPLSALQHECLVNYTCSHGRQEAQQAFNCSAVRPV